MTTPTTGKISYQFSLGEFKCKTLFDGHSSYPASNFFSNAPSDELKPILEKRNIQDTKISKPFRSLLIQDKSNTVLIDTGLGSNTSETAGHLLENLQESGISPDSIDTVIFSHGHIDHIGGAVDKNGNLCFPNARHIIGREEYLFWLSDLATYLAGESVTMETRQILLQLKNKFTFIEPEQEIIPGLKSISAPGHTPFSFTFHLQSNSRTAYYLSDILTHPIHLEKPDWYLKTDINPLDALRTREHFLNQISSENSLAILYHFPYPGVGYIHSKPDGQYEWSPLN